MHPCILNWNIAIAAVLTDFTNMAVMLSDLLRNLTFNRIARCTQVSDQCPLGLLFITVLSWLGRRPIGDWSATSRGPSPTGRRPVALSRKEVPHEVADQSATSPRLVADQSPTSRRPTAKPSCDLCDRFGFWSRRDRRAVAVYVWLRL